MEMNHTLVRKLIEAGAIRQQTEIEAFYMAADIAGIRTTKAIKSYFIRGVRLNAKTGAVIFDAISTVDGAKRSINNNDVVSIDGMDLPRLAENYNLDINGIHVPEPTRRGRKPGPKRAAEIAARQALLATASG